MQHKYTFASKLKLLVVAIVVADPSTNLQAFHTTLISHGDSPVENCFTIAIPIFKDGLAPRVNPLKGISKDSHIFQVVKMTSPHDWRHAVTIFSINICSMLKK